eukprot:CAMPEP_0197297104 /NCGR_PEP_ID=MMETSP0890-20130614/40135_1 /TAXON_ID=44058 ORGANISM="Aureoumbra lagunensis, Strain CCMP1510" /NCGR_SAMPLE_ID=MMETSP0890 /ASSEMBLY_ACC=CAM_ASM_000533 /LENGTH=428 /DNA_ID=CAMNT_0042774047 /DNA_START=40 /DNA_END=1326 /DNA_ORIENTATION=-
MFLTKAVSIFLGSIIVTKCEQLGPIPEPKDLVLWASTKYDPGTRDFTGKFAQALAEHGDEAMSNVEYIENTYPDNPFDPDQGITTWDDEHPAPNPLAIYSPYWHPKDGITRHPVLIMEDMENGYRPYVDFVIPRCVELVRAFREKDWPIIWTNWIRVPHDKAYGAIDRFYGPQGIKTQENPCYVYGPRPTETVAELSPQNNDEFSRTIKSLHLSKFADFDEKGNSILYPRLKSWGVDTIVLAGAWTDDCILATVFDAVDKYGFDVINVIDGVATTTHNHGNALKIIGEGMAYNSMTKDVLEYINTPDAFAQSPHFRTNALQFDQKASTKSLSSQQRLNNDAYLFPKIQPNDSILSDSTSSIINISLPFLFVLIFTAAIVGGLFATFFFVPTSFLVASDDTPPRHHDGNEEEYHQHVLVATEEEGANSI